METFFSSVALSAANATVTGEFPSQRPVMRCFDVFFNLHLNKRLSKQSRPLWFETSWHSLWRHCNVIFSLHCILVMRCYMWTRTWCCHVFVSHSRLTRTTFETPKYPRRPRDQYTAQIVNTLELSAPHQNWGKKTLSNLVISLVKLQTTNTCTYVAAKMVALWNSRIVKQSRDL